MRTFLSIALCSVLALSAAVAAPVPGYAITDIKSDSAGHFYIYFATNVSPGASCATQFNGMVVDVNTYAGRQEAGLAQLAFAIGSNVTVVGQGTCNLVPGWETLASIKATRMEVAPAL
jgi:hypothetical protein